MYVSVVGVCVCDVGVLGVSGVGGVSSPLGILAGVAQSEMQDGGAGVPRSLGRCAGAIHREGAVNVVCGELGVHGSFGGWACALGVAGVVALGEGSSLLLLL